MSAVTTKEYIANPTIKVYRALSDYNKGSVSAWEWNQDTENFFLTMAKQSPNKNDKGNAIFDWDNKITFKLSDWELAEISMVFLGRKKCLGREDAKDQYGSGLFHQTNDGNTILKISKVERGFGMVLSTKKGTLAPIKIAQLISEIEAYRLAIAINAVLQVFV